MKKTAIAMLTLAAGILAASCQKEAEPEVKSFEPMIINAVSEGVGTATKTEMAYKYDILWSEDDQIYVTDGTANDTFTLSDGKGTTKGTFTQDGTASFTSEVKAYYPATMVQDGGLVWPATQTNNQTVPMYSTKTVSGNVEDFNFSSLGSVLQIVFTTPQSDVTLQSIEIKDGTETMSGAFTVDTDGKANITATDKAGITLNLVDGVSVSNKISYFNIAVPAGNYQNLTLTFTATDGAKCVMTNGKVNIEHNTVGRLTLTGKTFKPDLPAGALPGVFSVQNGEGQPVKQVHFSKGNLWADGDNALHFEANQYAFNSSYESSHVSLFTWSSTIAAAVGKNNNGDYLFCDENNKQSVDGSDKIYYALSTAEWQYLFNTRTMEKGGVRFENLTSSGITVEGVTFKGVVLFPDDFTGQTTWKETYTTWEALNDAGIVFLPAAGYRYGSIVLNVGGRGGYWSSTALDESRACRVYFNSYDVRPDDGDDRRYGYSVRLITE